MYKLLTWYKVSYLYPPDGLMPILETRIGMPIKAALNEWTGDKYRGTYCLSYWGHIMVDGVCRECGWRP